MKSIKLAILTLFLLSIFLYSCNRQEKLANIAISNNDSIVRLDAVKKLHEQELLATVAVNANHGLVRAEAVKKLDADKWTYLMNDIMNDYDEFPYIRSIAENKLIEYIDKMDDKEELKRMIENQNYNVSEAAKKRLKIIE